MTLRHNIDMDLDSWTPEDNARRFAMMVAMSIGVFVGLVTWLALEIHLLLALVLGVLVGLISFYPLRWLLLLIYNR